MSNPCDDFIPTEVTIGHASTPRGMLKIGGGAPTAVISPLMSASLESLTTEIMDVAGAQPDLIEWRVDPLLASVQASEREGLLRTGLKLVMDQSPLPLLATIRTAAEGGLVDLSDGQYADFLAILATFADAVDLEICRPGAFDIVEEIHEAGSIAVASHHDFARTSSAVDMDRVFALMAKAGADVLKVAYMTHRPEDALRIMDAQVRASRTYALPVIGIGMGEFGAITRICGQTFANAATFASASSSSAPGQLSVEETRRGLVTLQR